MFAKIRQSPLPIPHPLAWSLLALAALAVVVALAVGGGAGAVDAAPPAQAPSGVTATRSADGAAATLNWTPATGAELQWVYAAQKLDPGEPDTYWGQLGIDTDTIRIHGRNLPGDTRTLEITGLHPGRAYQYGIATRTTNAAGQQTWSAWQRYNDIDTTSCYSSGAVSDAASNPGLLSDCRTLLGFRDALQGADISPRLNWSAARAVADWDGITVDQTPPRVIYLRMDNRQLTGVLPAGSEPPRRPANHFPARQRPDRNHSPGTGRPRQPAFPEPGKKRPGRRHSPGTGQPVPAPKPDLEQ